MRVLVIAALAGAAAYGVRSANAIGREVGGGAIESFDPDSQYHARRVARALAEGGWPASRDPLLAWPEHRDVGGAPIPWPPYYDAALTAVARARSAGEELDGEAMRRVAADTVARAPASIAALAAAAAALAASALAGGSPVAAAAGGLGLALSFAHLRYSYLGIGDHHTAVSCLWLALLWCASRALRAPALARPRASAMRGALAGALAGAMLGTWTASLALLVPLQAAMAWVLLRPGPAPPVGLALFAATFHKATLLAFLPAVLASPWKDAEPLDVVAASWFHVAWFGLAWFAFAPVVFFPRSAARRVPALAACALLGVLVVLARDGARDALDWASAANPFMASITESQPLATGPAGSLATAAKWLGPGALLLAPAFAWALWRVLARREDALLPWVLAVPPLVAAALLQRRFAELLAVPLAVLVARLVAEAWRARGPRIGLACFVLAIAHYGTLGATLRRIGGPRFVPTELSARHAATAELLSTLRDEPPDERRGVIAEWELGHAIEWWGESPTVATNFGLYVGVESFLAPWRVLYATDDGVIERLLEERDVGHVLVTRDVYRSLDAARRAGAAGTELAPGSGDGGPWRATLAARLLAGDAADAPPHPPFLRLAGAVRVAGPGGSAPFARLFERVPGARVELRASPGARVLLRVRVPAPDGGLVWSYEGLAGASGVLAFRVPYAAGTARAAELSVDGRRIPLEVSLENVRRGDTLAVVAYPD